MILSGRYLHIFFSYNQPVYKELILGNKMHKQRLEPDIHAVNNYAKLFKLQLKEKDHFSS